MEGIRELGSEYGIYIVWVITIILAVAGTKFYVSTKRKKGK